MTEGRVYLDYNASAPLRPEARAAMVEAMDVTGNPSSVHGEGRGAKGLIERARGQMAAALGCQADEIVFTSGATEAASVLARLPQDVGISVPATAHDALHAHRRIAPFAAGGSGHVLAMGLANGETGEISDLPTRADGDWSAPEGPCKLLCLDATQAIGRMPFAFGWTGADLAIISAHKFGGPRGVGALLVRQGLDIPTLQAGGGQEMGRRSGTENLIGIAGMAAALSAAMAELETGAWERVAALRDTLEEAVADASPDTICVAADRPRLPNTSMLVTPGWRGETQVMAMDLAGFAVSAGSACSSGKVRSSRVLEAMGVSDPGAGLRVSLGPDTSEEMIRAFAAAWGEKRKKLRSRAA